MQHFAEALRLDRFNLRSILPNCFNIDCHCDKYLKERGFGLFEDIPTLSHDLLLEQDAAIAVMYEHNGGRFERHEFTSLDDVIPITSLDISLALCDLYRSVGKRLSRQADRDCSSADSACFQICMRLPVDFH